MDYLIWILAGYFFGSIPIGYWIGILKGIDLTKTGSGSTGATNVLRNLGKIPALMTLIFDALKGFLPVYFAIRFQGNDLIVFFTAMACIIGHSKSIFLKFKGGKSSGTGLGILIALSWQVAIIIFSTWVIIVLTSKYSSLGSVIAIPLAPILLYLFHKPMPYVLFGISAAIYIVLFRHRENIKRLLNGTEPKISKEN